VAGAVAFYVGIDVPCPPARQQRESIDAVEVLSAATAAAKLMRRATGRDRQQESTMALQSRHCDLNRSGRWPISAHLPITVSNNPPRATDQNDGENK
jgi:hypothetical protein